MFIAHRSKRNFSKNVDIAEVSLYDMANEVPETM
jgi:hypothetical protein